MKFNVTKNPHGGNPQPFTISVYGPMRKEKWDVPGCTCTKVYRVDMGSVGLYAYGQGVPKEGDGPRYVCACHGELME